MCCSPRFEAYERIKVGECPTCGEDVNEYGEAIDSCTYSTSECDRCDSSPCDGSC